MNTQSEFDFLKDQVERLNATLSYYQDLFIEKSEKSGSNKMRILLNNNTAPLLAEYDRIIHNLENQLKENKTFLEQEQTRVNSIINENERLWKQLNSVQFCNNGSARQSGIAGNMQEQIDSLDREKESLAEIVCVCESEVSRLQTIVDEHNMKPQTLIFNEKMEEIKLRYQRSISELEIEVEQLRDIKRDLTNELGKLRKQISEIEKDNIMLIEKLKFEKESAEENSSQLKSCLKRIEYIDKEKKQLMNNIEDLRNTLRNHDSEKSEWNSVMESLESRYHEKEQQVYEISQNMKEAYQIAEDSAAEKKAAEIRESQCVNECDRLRGVISGILDDAGARTREEVDIVREKCEKDMERIVEELNLCEQNRQELLAEIDQIKRGKTQLEQEMELFHRAEREKNLQDLSSAEVSHERMMRAERERETLRLQLTSIENQLEKEKAEKQRIKENLESELLEFQKKVSQLQISCDKAQSNADRFAKLLHNSEESANQSRKKYQESLKKSRHELEILKQSFQIRHYELEARLESSEDTHRNSTAEMRQILHKQQQLSYKWKEEAHSISTQYEERLNHLTKEVERHNVRNSEMSSLLQQSKQQILESQETIEEKTKMIDILENKLRIFDEDGFKQINSESFSSTNDTLWKLKHIKKQQQKIIKDSVARTMKKDVMVNYI